MASQLEKLNATAIAGADLLAGSVAILALAGAAVVETFIDEDGVGAKVLSSLGERAANFLTHPDD